MAAATNFNFKADDGSFIDLITISNATNSRVTDLESANRTLNSSIGTLTTSIGTLTTTIGTLTTRFDEQGFVITSEGGLNYNAEYGTFEVYLKHGSGTYIVVINNGYRNGSSAFTVYIGIDNGDYLATILYSQGNNSASVTDYKSDGGGQRIVLKIGNSRKEGAYVSYLFIG
jgi:hypothetical protein